MDDEGFLCPACDGKGRLDSTTRRSDTTAIWLLALFVVATVVMTLGLATVYWVAASFLHAGTAGFFHDPGPFWSVAQSCLPIGVLGGGLTVAMRWAGSLVLPRLSRALGGRTAPQRRTTTVCPLCSGMGWYRPTAEGP